MAGDWKLLGDVFFRKVRISPMHWTVDLTNYVVTAASYGGPIALLKKSLQTSRFSIGIFSSSGKEIGSIQWNSGRILKMGWSNREELLCLQDDGNVLVYNIFGKFMGSFSMGKDANDVKVIDGKIFTTSTGSTGVTVLTSTHRFYLVTNIYDVKLKQLADLPDWDSVPSSWCVINIAQTPQILAAKEADLYMIDITGISNKQKILKTDQVVFYTEMSVSFDNKYLALFTSLGILWIGSSDLKETYCEYDTGNLSRPNQLVWCGKSAVVAKWDNYFLLVGPTKSHVKFEFDTPFHMVPEKDGVRIVGERIMEFLQKVPKELENVFKIGAVTPEIMMFEASRLFQEEKKESHEYIKTIKDDLPKAYLSCLKAAGYEFDKENQKALLKAAAFGKCFLSDLRTADFVDMCQKLRILNVLRSVDVGIAITIVQLNHLTLEVLIDRLMMRKLFWLAFEICKYLKMPGDNGVNKVLSTWACDKIQHSKLNDGQLAKIISTKLSEHRGVSYTNIINKAIECKRSRLALDLINFEPSATRQIPLLVILNKGCEALSKAIESGDSDLVALVLVQWKDKLQQGEFLRTISQFPVAYAFYLQQCKEQNREMLLDVHYQSDNHLEEALCKVAMSYEENQKNDQRLSNLVGAQEAFEKAKKDTFTKLTEEQIKLMRHQVKFAEELDRTFYNKSLNETLHDLLLNGNISHFEQLRKEFRISDKRIWSIRVRALVEVGDWVELDKLSKSKKFPLGYETLIDVCIKHKNFEEAKNYLSRVQPENLVRYHLKLDQLEKAAELALQSKNEDDLEHVLSKCPPSNKALLDKLKSLRPLQAKR